VAVSDSVTFENHLCLRLVLKIFFDTLWLPVSAFFSGDFKSFVFIEKDIFLEDILSAFVQKIQTSNLRRF